MFVKGGLTNTNTAVLCICLSFDPQHLCNTPTFTSANANNNVHTDFFIYVSTMIMIVVMINMVYKGLKYTFYLQSVIRLHVHAFLMIVRPNLH